MLAQLRKGVLDYAVLALLREAPAYGLEIAESMAEFAPLFGSEGTLYPLLTRLRKQGWVSDSWQESSAGPPRRYYAISPDGRAALAVFLATWGRFRGAVDRAVAEPRSDPQRASEPQREQPHRDGGVS